MRLRLIVNPAARSGRGVSYLQAALPVLRRTAGGEPEVVASRSAAHVAELAAEIAADPDATVVICGGDGSLYSAVQGMVGARAALGVLPLGTGNDFATCLGIPVDPVAAAEVIAAGRTRFIDLGRAEPAAGGPAIYFNCVAGVGLDADGIRRLRQVPWLTGNIKYAYGALCALWSWRPRRVRIRADDAGYDGPLMTVSIANTPTYGGGMKMTPQARMDDGLLDLCIIGDVPRGRLIRLMPKVYSGGHVGRPGVHLMRGRTVTVEADRPIPVCLDGELTELTTPAKFSVLPGALRVAAPAAGAQP